LFNLISGRFAPSSGDVRLHGQSLLGKKPFEINRLGLSRSFQITNIFPKLSVFENLRCSVLWSLGYGYTFLRFLADLSDANAQAAGLMERIGLAHKRDVLAMDLTYAEQRALEVGITIGGGADVVLLDEPGVPQGPASLVDVSDRYRGLVLHGAGAAEALNEGCPLDLADAAFPPSSCTRTLFGKDPL
jgi:ABC-type branched-subunit amino acid transport system ATPase component